MKDCSEGREDGTRGKDESEEGKKEDPRVEERRILGG